MAPDFAASEAERPLLAHLVRALDGLPLAIELAAARAGILGLADLLRGLERRFEVLRRARAAPADPHAALRAAFDASWELLGAPERSVFAQCAVFRGGFTLEVAEAVLVVPAAPGGGEPPGLLDVLDVLQRHSLIVEPRPRSTSRTAAASCCSRACAPTRSTPSAAPAIAPPPRPATRTTTPAARSAWRPRPTTALGLEALRWLARERANVVAAAATFLAPRPARAARAAPSRRCWRSSRGPTPTATGTATAPCSRRRSAGGR